MSEFQKNYAGAKAIAETVELRDMNGVLVLCCKEQECAAYWSHNSKEGHVAIVRHIKRAHNKATGPKITSSRHTASAPRAGATGWSGASFRWV
jgi:hypothetical protein